MTAWTRFSDHWQASGGRVIQDVPSGGGGGGGGGGGTLPTGYVAASAGATFPINDALGTLPSGKKYVYVATDGNSGNTGLTAASPKGTLAQALAVATPGDTIVLDGGKYTYPTGGDVISKAGLTIRAAPGAIPVFDGTQAAGTISTDPGDSDLRRFSYTPMQAVMVGEGVSLSATGDTAFPAATFAGGTGTATTGLALERGFVTVANGTYTYPVSQTKPASGMFVVACGMFPDQCWVDGKGLKQVLAKSLVKPGFFYVDRTVADDASPSAGYMYIHKDQKNAAGTAVFTQAQVRMSKNGGKNNALLIDADDVTLRGIRYYGHSNSLGHFTIQIQGGVSGTRLENVEIDYGASISLKFMGSGTPAVRFSETDVIKNAVMDRVTISNTGWMGTSVLYVNNTKFTHCLFKNINWPGELDASPKSGAIKGSKANRIIIEYCIFDTITSSHGVWLDQSCYDCVFASNYMVRIPNGSYFFWEISHKVLIVNNLFVTSGNTGDILRISGAGGTRLVNNTVVGGNNQIYIVADKRGGSINGRTYSEHTERYGSGSLEAETTALSSDLDKARAGQYATGMTNRTLGMTWRAGATLIINNVMVSETSGDGQCMFIRPKTGESDDAYQDLPTAAKSDIIANQAVPTVSSSFNGNVYQSLTGPLGQVQVRASLGAAGAIAATRSLSVWKGSTGFAQSHYGLSAEANGAGGTTVWVTRSTGKPTSILDAIQGQAQAVPTDTDINTYVTAGSRFYGSRMTPTGGWS